MGGKGRKGTDNNRFRGISNNKGCSGRGQGYNADGRGKSHGRGGKGQSTEAKPVAVNHGDQSSIRSEQEDGANKHAPKTAKSVESLRSFSSSQWWLMGQSEGQNEVPTRKHKKPEEFQQQCKEKHEEMKQIYDATMMRDSEQRWLRKVSAEGTAGDKIASLTLLIQVCPVFSTGYIKALLTMANKSGRSDSLMAVDALKDMFINSLLPDRKLKTMSQMESFSPKGLDKIKFTEKCVVAFFEDYLKTAFAAFVHVLSEMAHNTMVFYKTKAIKTVYELLAAKPEQEKALLSLLINKFGDSAPKVSSNVSFHVKKLLEVHPAMKSILAKEVEVFLARPNITEKSQYSAMLTLSEIKLARKDGEYAAQIVQLFVKQLERLLTAPANSKSTVSSKKAKRRLKRFKQKKGKEEKKPKNKCLGDDNNRLIRTCINGVHRAAPYLDAARTGSALLKVDTINTLFRVCHTVTAFSTRIAILSLLYQCVATQRDPPDRFYRLLYEQITHFEFFTNTHHLKAFLLLQRCVPADVSIGRGVAMSRRLLQFGANAEPSVSVAALTVLRDLLVAHRTEIKPLLQSIDSALHSSIRLDDDEEEHFVDDDLPNAADASISSVAHTEAHDQTAGKADLERKRYQPLIREPRHARAQHTPLWELYTLVHHVHPFVAHGATRLLSIETFQDVSKNPFDTFSSGELLEQFVHASHAPKDDQGKKDRKTRVQFNSQSFLNQADIAPHEQFSHLYFSDAVVQKFYRRKARKKQERTENAQDEEPGGGDDQDEEDAFFEEHIREQMPKDDEEDDEDDNESDAGSDLEGDDDADDADDDDDEADNVAGSCSEDEGSMGGSGSEGPADHSRKKRSAAQADLPRHEQVKALKKKHSSSMFASAADFEELLAEDNS